MADPILINGNVHSYASLVAKIANVKWNGFTAINYAQKRPRSKVYGMGRAGGPRGRTSGRYEPDPVTVKGPKSTIAQLKKELAQRSSDQKSYGNVAFDLTLQYIDAGEQSITVLFEGLTIVGESTSNEEGPDAIIEELTLDVMRIKENGLTLYDGTTSRSV
jgi:hypothetical protein